MLRLEKLSSTLHSTVYDHLIVGAGIAGLYAAKLLAENGVKNFVILEAQEGMGGRVETIRLGQIIETNKSKWIKKNSFLSNFPIERGATWIEQPHALMLHLAKELGIQLRQQFREGESTFVAKERVYTSEDILQLPSFYTPVREFLKMFMQIAQKYDKHVLSSRQIDETYREMVEKYDNAILEDYIQQSVLDPFIRDFIHNFIEHSQCIDLKEDSVHQFLRACKSGDIQFMQDFLGVDEETSYLVNGGTEVYLEKITERIEKALRCPRDTIIRFNEEVIQVDNSVRGSVKVKSIKNGKSEQVYFCKEVILSIPLGILHKIRFTKLSPEKQLIFQNQTRNLVAKSFIVAKRPFWKEKHNGDGLYCKQYPISMSHDVSPPGNECGILVFFHCGEKYTRWHQKFPTNMPDRAEAVRQFYVSLLAKMYLEGNEQSPELEDIVYINANIIDNRFVNSGFQSNYKPGTMTALMKMGKVLLNCYDDENSLIFIGSEFSNDFNSFMEGAVRSASKKINSILGQPDPIVELERLNDGKRQSEKQVKGK